MTEKLFYQDSHLKEFDAEIIECQKQEDYYKVVLNRTAFFPEGGGQPADEGILNDFPVLDVREEGDKIYHQVAHRLEPGTAVHGNINYAKRFSRMQQHTGEHIVSGIVHGMFKYDNVGFHLGHDIVTMDFNGEITMEDLRLIEQKANEAVAANLPVRVTYPGKQELAEMDYRSKKEIAGEVRIVQEVQNYRQKLQKFQQFYLERERRSITDSTVNFILFMEEADKNIVRRFVDDTKELCQGVCAVFVGNDDDGYRYVMGSDSIDMRMYSKVLNAELNGKGGGSRQMVQGTLLADEIKIRHFLKSRIAERS